MKTIFFGAMLIIAVTGFCSEENESICVDNRFFFQINNPDDYEVNIKFLDESSNLLYEHDLFNGLHPGAITKKVLIDFSSRVITVKSILLNGNSKVIAKEKESDKDDKIEEILPSNYLITMTRTSDHDTELISNQCYSSNDQEKVEILQASTNTFLNQLNIFELNMRLFGATEIDESKKEQLFNEKIHSLGYKKDACGRYVHINSSSSNLDDCVSIAIPVLPEPGLPLR
ncbi:hypothetical protein [Endozoicomonas sp. 8E]|uniref:hypothetical protein n=1 Tax=Endozoicomonas sp. 8E TaxID=3035692 RepID=UPI002938D59B|nr:hypothetical protein [Endozoicomonas sp. 8E]WOG27628.1 hypothetical protein P6910_24280 [Endozoicomonas sp. 8E]